MEESTNCSAANPEKCWRLFRCIKKGEYISLSLARHISHSSHMSDAIGKLQRIFHNPPPWMTVAFGIWIAASAVLLYGFFTIKPVDEAALNTNSGRSMPQHNQSPINISGNTGNTQVTINSPGSQQVINQKRTISRNARVEKGMRSDLYITRLILQQTDGIWDAGSRFIVRVQFTGPFVTCKIIQGMPSALMGVIEKNAPKDGFYEFSTMTPPQPGVIVVEAESAAQIDVKEFGISPGV